MVLPAIFTLLAGASLTFTPPEQAVAAADVTTEIRKVGAFEGLALEGSVTVEVKQGTPAMVAVVGPAGELSQVETYVRDETLHVRGGGAVKVRITAPLLKEVVLAGSGSVVGEGRWKVDAFSVAVSGSGELSMAVDAAEVEIAVTGSGDVQLAGEARRAQVAIQGSGSVELGVKERLQAAIAGSGSVRYRGPDDVQVQMVTTGSGRVRRAD